MRYNKTRSTLLIVSAAVLLTVLTGLSQSAKAVTPYIGTIRYFGFNFEPLGWAFCDGQILSVSDNDALFSLIGSTYGGNGRTTFALPDMRGRLPVHRGQGIGLSNRTIGSTGGAETVTLSGNQIGHTHTLRAQAAVGNQSTPGANALAQSVGDNIYRDEVPSVTMHASSITSSVGGNNAHENRPPFLGVHCNIALFGIFPTRN